MKPPRNKKPGATWVEATGQTDDRRGYAIADDLQDSLAQHLNGPAAVSQLLPVVLTKTLTLGFRLWQMVQTVGSRTLAGKEKSKP